MIQGTKSNSTLIETLETLLAGKEPETWRVSGVKLTIDVVLLRDYPAHPYTLNIKLDDVWYEACKIPATDPLVAQWREQAEFVDRAEPPHAIEKRAKLECKRVEELQAYEDYKASRRSYHEKLRAMREEQRRKETEERRVHHHG